LFSLSNVAQSKPEHWSYSIIKVKEGVYEVHCTVTVVAPWHIYSQNTPKGGPLPTVFMFNKNPLITMQGKPVEKGKLVEKHEAVFNIDVKYYETK